MSTGGGGGWDEQEAAIRRDSGSRTVEPERGETCVRCARPVGVVWLASDELWMSVYGSPRGKLCPPCFSAAAQDVGISVWFDCRRHTAEPCIPVEQNGTCEQDARLHVFNVQCLGWQPRPKP